MNPILAVDPGKRTGWATYSGIRPYFGEAGFSEFHEMAFAWLDACRHQEKTPLVVCERFVITGGTTKVSRGDTNWSIETIGVLRWITERFGFTFELQGAADAKRFGGDALLRRLGWWTRGSDHARDAGRHLALALARHHPTELDRLLRDAEN